MNVLVAEDCVSDFLQIERLLRQRDPLTSCLRVASLDQVRSALDTGPWDVVLSDYNIPGMRFAELYNLVIARQPDVPVILVSGTIGEEKAVKLLKLGIADFVLKDHLGRIAPAVERCLREAADRRAKQATEIALRDSEERLRLALTAANQGLYDVNVQTGACVVSPEYVRMLGYDPAAFRESSARWFERTHPDDRGQAAAMFRQAVEGTVPVFQVEVRQRTATGEWRWFRSVGKIVARAPDGQALRMLGTQADITERKTNEARIERLTQLYAALSECNEAIVRSTTEDDLFRQVCAAAVEFGGMKMAWIGLVDEATRRVVPVAAFGGHTEYLNDIDISVDPDLPSGRGPTGIAIRESQPFWCQDFATNPVTTHWHDRARRAVWNASASLPLRRRGNGVGCLNLYSGTANAFDEEARTLLLEMAMDISFALDNFVREAERKQAEGVVRRNEIYFRSLIEHAADIISVVDPGGIFTYGSPAVEQVLGFRPEELTGQSALALVHPDDVPALGDLLRRGFASPGACATAELRFRHKDGSLRILDSTFKAIADEPGRYIGVINSRDVTERRNAEAALRLRSAALNAAADAMVITDRHATVVWINPAFTALTGYGPEDAIGRNPRDLIKSGAQAQAFYRRLWETILAGEVWRGELVNRRKDGSTYSEDQSITPVKDARGEITHFIGIKRDLTEQKRLEAQFLQAQKMESVGRLAGGVAHDFNNLLTVINGTAALALSSVRAGDPLREDLHGILRAGERAVSLTKQLLAFSRKQLMKPEVLDLGSLVANMRAMLPRLIGEDVELIVLGAEKLGSVRADPGQLEQVVLNLVVNARDAMPGGGRLTIETRNVDLDQAHASEHPSVHAGPHVMLAVSDTGIGMDEATRARIFEPFFTTKESGKGTGLGLATVYGIVKQSGGSIWAYSEVGQGTTFKIYLPRVDDEAKMERQARPREAARGSETILVVEDDKTLCRLATRMLESAGYEVLTAHNGGDAIAALKGYEGPVHLMLTDVVMPGMGGRELACGVAEFRPETRVLYMSGYTDDTILRSGLLDSTAHFIAKPYTVEGLTRKVREVLDEKPSRSPEILV